MTKDEESKASNGWFHQFKRRCNWHTIAQNGQTASVDNEAASYYPLKLN